MAEQHKAVMEQQAGYFGGAGGAANTRNSLPPVARSCRPFANEAFTAPLGPDFSDRFTPPGDDQADG